MDEARFQATAARLVVQIDSDCPRADCASMAGLLKLKPLSIWSDI